MLKCYKIQFGIFHECPPNVGAFLDMAPCKFLCCVLHRFTHKLCPFELFFYYVFQLQCFHWLALQTVLCLYSDSFSLCLDLHVQIILPSIS